MTGRTIPTTLLLACALTAQTTSTEILGTVTDPSGASVAGAQVTLLRTATGQKREAVTNAAGDYSFPLIEIGDTSSPPGRPVSRPKNSAVSRSNSSKRPASISGLRSGRPPKPSK